MTPIAPNLRRIGAALLACCAASFASANEDITVTLLDETFAADQRLVENLPATAAWYGSGATNATQPSAGSIVLSHTNVTSSQFIFHFTPAGSPYALAVGETLNVSLDFNLTKAIGAGSAIRLGVLNSQNTRVTADGAATSNTTFADDRGYGFFFSPDSTATSNLSLRARTTDNNSLFTALVNGPWGSVNLAAGPGSITVAADQTYTLLLKVTRTGTGADVSAQISGGNLAAPISIAYSATNEALTFTSFDKFGMCILATASSGTVEDPGFLTISRAKVTAVTPAPPPPPPPPAENNVFLDETFLNGERTTENLPATAAWYGSSSTLGQVADGSIRSTYTAAANQHVFTHFRPVNQAYTLTEGEKLTVSFDFSLNKPLSSATGIRFGLFDSGGTRVTNDTTGVSSTTYGNDRGYGVFMNPLRASPTSTGGLELRGRTTTNSNLLHAVAAWTATPYTTTDNPLMMAANQTYTMVFSVRRTATGTQLKATLSGGDLADPVSLSYDQETATPFISFDQFAIGLLSNAYTATAGDPAYFTLSNVSVTATTLPETVSSTQLFGTWAGDAAVTFVGDGNGDGVADGLAWLIGTPTATTNAAPLLPVPLAAGGELDLTFSLRTAADRGTARLSLQHSPDLATWTTVIVPETSGAAGGIDFVVTPDGAVNDVQASIPASIVGTGGRFFVRLIGELEPAP